MEIMGGSILKDDLELSEQQCIDCFYKSMAGCSSAYVPTQCINGASSDSTAISERDDYEYTGQN